MIPFGSTLPLIPVGITIWGKFVGSILSLSAWVIGSSNCFFIARWYGKKMFERFALVKQIRHFSLMLPEKNIFWGTVFFGLIGAPADIIGYAFGLFTTVSFGLFISAFIIGLIPFIFFLAYITTLSISYQTYTMFLLVVVWFLSYSHLKSVKTQNEADTRRR